LNIAWPSLEINREFKYMHSLFGPLQTKHPGYPNSKVQPNKIGPNEVVLRSVNLRRLRVDASSANLNVVDAKVGIHPGGSKANKHVKPKKIVQITHENKMLQPAAKRPNTPSPKMKKKKTQSRSNSNPAKMIKPQQMNNQKAAKPYKQRSDKKAQPQVSRNGSHPVQATNGMPKSIQPLKTAASIHLPHQQQ